MAVSAVAGFLYMPRLVRPTSADCNLSSRGLRRGGRVRVFATSGRPVVVVVVVIVIVIVVGLIRRKAKMRQIKVSFCPEVYTL